MSVTHAHRFICVQSAPGGSSAIDCSIVERLDGAELMDKPKTISRARRRIGSALMARTLREGALGGTV